MMLVVASKDPSLLVLYQLHSLLSLPPLQVSAPIWDSSHLLPALYSVQRSYMSSRLSCSMPHSNNAASSHPTDLKPSLLV